MRTLSVGLRPRRYKTTGIGLYFLLSVLIAWSGGCALLKPFSPEPVNRSAPIRIDAYQRGMQYYKDGFYQSAVAELGNVPASHLRFEKAQSILKLAERRTADADTHAKAADGYQQQTQLSKARRELEKALEAYPKHRKIQRRLEQLNRDMEAAQIRYFDQGRQQYDMGDYDKAQVSFREALKMSPDNEYILARLSETRQAIFAQSLKLGGESLETGDLNEAITHLERAYLIAPQNPVVSQKLVRAYNFRALKLYREDHLILALQNLERSLKIKANQEDIQVQLQQIYTRIQLLQRIDP